MSTADTALTAALAPPRALQLSRVTARLRVQAEDFRVEEDLGFAPAGQGPHLLLKVLKRNANTRFVAQQLARAAGCRAHDVGYAGLKDRRAVAVQWFSVPRPRQQAHWDAVAGPAREIEVLEVHAHQRKLPRGALAGNRFAIRLRAPDGHSGAALAARLAEGLALIRARGVPNYFGPQRFGRAGANLLRAQAGLARLGRDERGFVLSAARSAVFNAVLAARVANGGWECLHDGDLAMLDGRGSFFAADPLDEAQCSRLRALDLHPSGPLWGEGEPQSGGAVRELEQQAARELAPLSAVCVAAAMRQERRALRMAVRGLDCAPEPDAVVLKFALARGCFATAVLRELVDDEDAPQLHELPDA